MLGLGSSATRHKKVFADLNDVSGLQLWLKNGVGVAVGQWDDSSRQGRHATQGTAGDQATVSGGGLDFEEGEGDHYDFTEIAIAKSQGFCCAWVQDSESNTNNTIVSDSSTEVIQIQNSNKLRIITNNDSTVTTQLHTTGAYGGSKMLILLNRSGAGVWSSYTDGSEVTIEADSANSANGDDGQNIMGFTIDTLGAKAGSSHFFDGKIYELAFWDRDLTTREIADVNTYLVGIHGL